LAEFDRPNIRLTRDQANDIGHATGAGLAREEGLGRWRG